MDEDRSLSIQLVERRLTLLRELACSLEQAEAAVLCSDLAELNRHTAGQQQICTALRELESEARHHFGAADLKLAGTRRNCLPDPGADAPPNIPPRLQKLCWELKDAEAQVRRLNQIYGALLRRARRTVEIFSRALASSAVTYVPPKPAPAAGGHLRK
jgi:hypothetical protein